jgi:hypothetical protein
MSANVSTLFIADDCWLITPESAADILKPSLAGSNCRLFDPPEWRVFFCIGLADQIWRNAHLLTGWERETIVMTTVRAKNTNNDRLLTLGEFMP